MKKWVIVRALLIIVFFISVFIFIPRTLTVSNVIVMKANRYAAIRNLQDQSQWLDWWPGLITSKDNRPSYNGYRYSITNKFYNGIDILLEGARENLKGKVVVIPFSDSIAIQWQTTLSTGLNPVQKLLKYREAIKIKESFHTLLDSLKSFNEDKQRVYKLNIYTTTLKDTALIAIKATTLDTPSTLMIYRLVDSLKHYIALNKSRETNLPILNCTKLDGKGFVTMVAIATERVLPGNEKFLFKRMIPYKDKILVADVKGGPATIKQTYDKISLYMEDHQLSSPVIPFEYLITDRSKEADTANWITKIYVPIR